MELHGSWSWSLGLELSVETGANWGLHQQLESDRPREARRNWVVIPSEETTRLGASGVSTDDGYGEHEQSRWAWGPERKRNGNGNAIGGRAVRLVGKG